MKREFKGKEIYGRYTLLSKISSGGNGEVWVCKNDQNEQKAIKLLKKDHFTAYQRFIDEIVSIAENQDIEGVIKIEEHFMPQDFANEIPFYVMPLGTSFEEGIKKKDFEEKVDAMIKLTKCLNTLHERGFAHRDIKPANLIFIGANPHLIDFGLVDFPDKADITKSFEKIGPRWTMAPEINRQSGESINFFKSDVYSLAKTLWIILTGNKLGFEGQYNTDTILAISTYYPDEYTTPIDNLLRESTDNDPSKRPSSLEFLVKLKQWKSINRDFHLKNNQQWADILNVFFPIKTPQRAIWEDTDEIIYILQLLSKTTNLNHLFFPDHGGSDLENARRSTEEGCIELDFQLICIVKPIRLVFESFRSDANWNYFRLETGGLMPSIVYSKEELEGRIREEVSELHPGQYDAYDLAENKSYYREMGYDIPQRTRHVTRYFQGAFVIFNKRSHYNLDTSTYDGRHNKMSTDGFREYIQKSIESLM